MAQDLDTPGVAHPTPSAVGEDFIGDTGDNELIGTENDDFFDGGLGADRLIGLGGNDTFNLSAGDVFIDGGTGVDTLQLSLARSSYDISVDGAFAAIAIKNSENVFVVVEDVEQFEFADGVRALGELGSDDFLFKRNVAFEPFGVFRLLSVREEIDLADGRAFNIGVSASFTDDPEDISAIDGDRFIGFDEDDTFQFAFGLVELEDISVVNAPGGADVTVTLPDQSATFFIAGYDQYTFRPEINFNDVSDSGDLVGDVPQVAFPNAANLATYDGADDVFTGSPTGGDVMSGLGGDDTFNGLGGADDLFGGEGNDTLDGGADADNLSGNEGDDTIDGGDGVTPGLGGTDEDRVFYNKPRDQYVVKQDGSDIKVGDRTLEEGVDTVRNVEVFVFTDGEIAVGDLSFDADPLPITDPPPSDLMLTPAAPVVSENAAGALIGVLELAGELTDGVSWSVSDPRFEVVANQLKLLSGASLDFETDGAAIDVTVGASSSDGSSSATFSLTVLDVVETITLPNGGVVYQEDGLPEARVTGGTGDDRMLGGVGDDVFDGGLGGDTIRGGRGDDEIIGGGGDDRRVIEGRSFVGLTGDAGDDEVSGGGGIDVVRGGAGNDIVRGGAGDDALLSGDAGDDEVYGGDGDDVILRGGADNDLLDGGAGDDRLVGDRGDDELLGGTGADTLLGGAGNDILNGGAGNDVLIGGFLRAGGAGFDTAGLDTFVFAPGTGTDIVRDFTLGEDQIDVSAYTFASAQQLLQSANQSGDNVVLDLGGGDSATLRDVALATLSDDDFIL